MINCLFGCFDRILVLSVEDRCHLMSARGTGNFDILFISSGNRHKFTSMFKCASLVHPCTSVACCQTKFQVPLTALIRHLHFDDQYQYFVKHRKDGFYRKKKNRPLRTVTFHHMKINVLRLLQNFLINFLPHRNPLILPVNPTRIKNRKPDQLCTVQVLMMHIDSVN